MYNIGDKIVHPMHGAGTIDNIVSQVVDGKAREYYVLKLHTNNLTIMVPVASSSEIGIRDVISPSEADKVLELFSTVDTDDIPNWNKRYRDNALKIKSGDIKDVVCVIKSLSCRDAKIGLSSGERKMLHSALQILVSELVIAKNSTKEEIKKEIDGIIEKTIKNET